ncbi:hypothetical protein [Variovorax sp. AFSI2.2]|uniref:hypothetical protein n=1 Tax=Variovorax sp. AFSI2.2 TaxID=3384160 RepID=UPI003EB89031
MTNSLIKNTTIDTTVEVMEIPAIPYVPAQPARTVYETRRVCGFQQTGSGHYTYVTEASGAITAIWVPDPGTPIQVGTWGCWDQLVPVTYPATAEQLAVPGSPGSGGTVSSNYNLGWNAGGRSIAMFTANGYVQFQARASAVGIIAGLNVYDGVDAHYSGNTTDYAFLLSHGVARVIQNGVQGAYLGTYTDATVFKIDRTGTTITYYMAGVSVATATSAPTAPAWLEVSLYSGDDEVFNPSLVQVSAPDLTAQTATLDGVLLPLTFFGTQGPFAELSGVLPALTAQMESGVVLPNYAVGDWQLPPLAMSLNGLTGETATLAGTLLGLRMLAADHPYAEMFATLPPLTANLSAYEGNFNASIGSVAVAGASMTLASFLVVSMLSTGTVASTLVVHTAVSAEMLSEAALGSTFAANAVVDAVMLSLASSGTVLGVPESDNETWVINLDSGGNTSYSNYAFNSFARIGSKYYGASAAGIFELDGDTDDGALIRSRISLGELDFGNPMLKTVSECYVGMSGTGHLFVKLIAEGREFVYKTRGYSDKLRQQRVTFGKGLRTNYVELELFNEDGADFELDTVEFHVADLSRRI